MAANITSVIMELATTKQIDKSKIEEEIKISLYTAISKKLLPENELEIIADFENDKLAARIKKLVVEEDMKLGDISLQDALKINKKAKLGDYIEVEVPIVDFEPKIINIARKTIQERIRKIEEDRIIFDYEKQKGQIVSGKIRSVDYNGYKIDIGYTDALLPVEEQVESEYYKVNDIIRSYVVNIRKRRNEVMVILSRNRPEFVQRLFELEIPEIHEGDVIIKKIVREPGIRTKVAVSAQKKAIDPVGACFGKNSTRIDMIRRELHGEIIDVISWDESPEQLIANAIGNDLVDKVYLSDRGRFGRIVVSEKNKNLAIGKQGKNVRLAAKLTEYSLDIYTEEEFEEKIAEERRITSHISELDGVTPKIADILKKHGYTSVQDIFKASIEELCSMENIGEKTAQKIKESAEYF
ncbi:MAG: transcription termination factor NusA [Candidatus Cloacimonetes bacterium]|nr:transcription termination factor NusA [Candidatus Cloacimonadota bacterium]